jgi:hypothetical protein
MVTKEEIMELLRMHINRVLLIAESSLTESQFKAYRKLILDEFGQSGLEKELETMFKREIQKERQG